MLIYFDKEQAKETLAAYEAAYSEGQLNSEVVYPIIHQMLIEWPELYTPNLSVLFPNKSKIVVGGE